jgi:hypothetical protein
VTFCEKSVFAVFCPNLSPVPAIARTLSDPRQLASATKVE